MTRHCDQCNKILDLDADYIEVRAIGVKDFRKLFAVNKLDFCSVTCLAEFLGSHRVSQKQIGEIKK
jgi:hypothetical protein